MAHPEPARDTTGGRAGGPSPLTEPGTRDPAWGARVVIAGLVAMVVALALAVAFFDDAKDVVAITGPAFGVISGLVAAYFGIRAGSLATERVQGAAVGQPPPVAPEKRGKSPKP